MPDVALFDWAISSRIHDRTIEVLTEILLQAMLNDRHVDNDNAHLLNADNQDDGDEYISSLEDEDEEDE